MANLYQLWEEHRARFVHEHKEQRVGDFTIVPNIKNLTWEHVPQPIQKEFEVWLNRQGIHSEETKERSKAVLFGPSEKLPHPLNIYTGFYTQIEKLTGDLPAFLREMKHIKLKSEGFMDLVIESIGNNRISMAHYYEQEHDLMADPEMEIEILTDQKTAEPLTYKQDGLGIYNVVYQYDDKGKKTHVDAKMKTELRNFLRKWLQNIRMQGFVKEGTSNPGGGKGDHCPKCGSHWITHRADGSCPEEEAAGMQETWKEWIDKKVSDGYGWSWVANNIRDTFPDLPEDELIEYMKKRIPGSGVFHWSRLKKAKLTPEEDKAWIFAFEHYRAEGHSDSEADKLAWRDIVKEFPRLKEFSGAETEPAVSPQAKAQANIKAHVYSYTKRPTVSPELAKAMRKLADMERDHPPDSDALRVQKALVKNLREKYGKKKRPDHTYLGKGVFVRGRVGEQREEEPFSEEVAEDILRQSLGEDIGSVVEHIKHAISYLSTAHGILSDLMHQVPDHPLMKKFLDLEHDLEATVTNLALYVED